jgi:hypothetical protein
LKASVIPLQTCEKNNKNTFVNILICQGLARVFWERNYIGRHREIRHQRPLVFIKIWNGKYKLIGGKRGDIF